MEEKRNCENCGNTACSGSVVAYNYDDCVESNYTRHWKPKDQLVELDPPVCIASFDKKTKLFATWL